MKIVKHVDHSDKRKRLVSTEKAYTTVNYNDIIFLRVETDYGEDAPSDYYWNIGRGENNWLLCNDEENLALEKLYQIELERLERENKLKRILNEKD
ncbi:MAG: hypothetical protein M0R46_11725 [Candidatus Muirbacterium halophilum]|nr:hypothetical protein [Candidatus Muirbacterium halophilum]